MKSLNLCETKKLHYGKYVYKLVLSNLLNTIFRTELQKDNKLSFARKQLDIATECYRNDRPILVTRFRTELEVPIEDYLDAYDIYNILKSNTQEYKIRVSPYRSLIVYSNDKDLLLNIASKMRRSAIEFHEPNEDAFKLLMGEDNIIIVDHPTEFPIKVTLGSRNKNVKTHELGNWFVNNTDKSKVGNKTLEIISTDGWFDGLYFYVRDEKVLMLIQLMIGSAIRRIDKLVYKGDLDKY